MTLHLTLKMSTAQAVETSVTNNSLSKDYPHPDDHAKQITDTPGIKPFTTDCVLIVLFLPNKCDFHLAYHGNEGTRFI